MPTTSSRAERFYGDVLGLRLLAEKRAGTSSSMVGDQLDLARVSAPGDAARRSPAQPTARGARAISRWESQRKTWTHGAQRLRRASGRDRA